MIPELATLSAPSSLLRIPPELDVPVTPRVMDIVDAAPMRRLAQISQLGLVALVYPGGVHSRLEHSLGVYRGSLLVLNRLADDPQFSRMITAEHADAFVLAALLHDVGHWPYCHAIEDMQLEGVPRHEDRARRLISGAELEPLISSHWQASVESVLRILEKRPADDGEQLLASVLSGPIDIDKMDYLVRDSLHCGVPYGRNFDANRLVSGLRIHPHQPKLAIGDKARTAAEMMVFARYVMFSEVYWHHAVRSATAMLQRAVYLLRDRLDLPAMYDLDDHGWTDQLRQMAEGTSSQPLVEGLFGRHRRLLKRIAQFNVLDDPDRHRQLAHRPYPWLAEASQRLAERLGRRVGMALGPADVIIDAPPVKLEVDINIDVLTSDGAADRDDSEGIGSRDEVTGSRGDCDDPRSKATERQSPRPLGSVSPVVEALARRQFDSHVKRVRVFVRQEVRQALPGKKLVAEDLDAVL